MQDVLEKLDELEPSEVDLAKAGALKERSPEELEWLEKRRGKLTASNFNLLVSKGRAKADVFSVQGYRYLHLKIAERLGSEYHFTASSTEWGKQHEQAAIDEYNRRRNEPESLNPLIAVRFPFKFYEDYPSQGVGCTPDAIVERRPVDCTSPFGGVVECKVPWNPAVHVNTLLTGEVPKEYMAQMDGQMMVMDRAYVDFISFDPRIQSAERLVVIRVERDEKRIEQLRERLQVALDYIDEKVKEIESKRVRRSVQSVYSRMSAEERAALLEMLNNEVQCDG